jgi:hypothetical protein
VAHDTEADRLAAYLRMLKDRTGRSFDALGRRAGISGSSLHRYCAGNTVPTEFAGLLGFGRACGATPDELRELRRLWVLADAGRGSNRPASQDPGVPDPPSVTGGPARPRPSRRVLFAIGTAVVLVGVTVAIAVWSRDADRSHSSPNLSTREDRLLFSAACSETVNLGQNDECVREVQRLLKEAGGRLAVDGSFGPETLRRVTAFQVLAGLPARGVVDQATKHALYDGRITLETWSTTQVERRIREVFVAEPDRAVAIADCQSYLDPQWLQPNPNGTRNWGVFQISDYRLTQLRASPLQALDPEWNIQAAYRLWTARPDFSDWPSCARAARIPRSPSSPAAG